MICIIYHLNQACQTQTTLRAAKATKTALVAAKNAQKFLSGLQNIKVENDSMMLYKMFSAKNCAFSKKYKKKS